MDSLNGVCLAMFGMAGALLAASGLARWARRTWKALRPEAADAPHRG